MAPKDDIRNKLATVLNLDIEALSDINISSYVDIMYIFFEMLQYPPVSPGRNANKENRTSVLTMLEKKSIFDIMKLAKDGKGKYSTL